MCRITFASAVDGLHFENVENATVFDYELLLNAPEQVARHRGGGRMRLCEWTLNFR
jgi:hypothetical protein